MSYTMPTFTFTHAAQAFAHANGGMDALNVAAQAAVVDLMGGSLPDEHTDEDNGPPSPTAIYFHSFSFHGDYNMIMVPDGNGLLVDVSEPEESEEPLDSGPFKGMRVVMPRMFSDE